MRGLGRLLLGRLGHLLLVLWVVTTLIFLMFRLMSGDPTLNFLSPTFNERTRDTLLKNFGPDKPLWDALPSTVILTLVSPCIAYAFGIIAGAFLAFHRGGVVEGTAIPLALATRSAPGFWWHLCLPALTLPLLLMRATMLEVMGDEFIVMARMKGLSCWSIVMRQAARNARLPVVTVFALSLGASIADLAYAWLDPRVSAGARR